MSKLKENTKSILREIKYGALSVFVNPSPGVHLMNSHLLNSHLLTKEKKLNSDFFDHQLKIISKKSTIIPFGEAVEIIKSHKMMKHSLVAFSYDDGFEEQYSHIAPVLEKYNGYGCFFVNPNFIDGDDEYIRCFLKHKVHLPTYKRSMTWAQINNLHKRGHIIGAHTMDHTRVSEINKMDELDYQIGESKRIIESLIKADCDYFAFPYGHIERDFDIFSVEIAEKYYNNIFSASNPTNYFSYEGRVLNRRHCEPYWKASRINYFLSKEIIY